MEKFEQPVINKEIADKVKTKLLNEDKSIDLAEFFKIFGDSTRIKILNVLSISKLCVCDIAYVLNMHQSAISHQLKILKQTKIVKYERLGREIYYEIDDAHIEKIFKMGVEHIDEI